ncbi:iron chelate uptake ABC transporter family permease subunit [Corynebacterium sp. 4HC-13]|uniref:FecCD family ABC transporter permease n=1 Tax=Corynebacterium anserum TaxID=2684406 RepID=UPI00163A5AE6|nr:iron ABC transporter permease [Corynebacterium anserum]MBC2682237.1 iron chelate uptake ABC transporter family permease subunit [Corynebacterium anserum]
MSSIRKRRVRGLAALLVALFLACTASMALGSLPISPTFLISFFRGDATSPSPEYSTIVEHRIPRTLIGLLIGLATGSAGAVIQGHTRNPLADPGLLGTSSGAAFAVVIAITYLGVHGVHGMAIAALLGALGATIITFLVASVGKEHAHPLTLILVGAALSAALSSFTTMIVLSDAVTLDTMRLWTVSSLEGRDMPIFWGILPFILIGLVLAVWNAPQINMLNLGDDTASALGVHTSMARFVGISSIAILVGASTAAAGPIAFIGLMVPHIARTLTGPDYRWVLPYSAIAGATLLLTADVIGRVIIRPAELHMGIMLAIIGAPLCLSVLWNRKRWSL